MFDVERRLLINSESLSGADCILDLSAVEVTPCKSLVVIYTERLHLDVFNGDHFLNERLPYALFGLVGEFTVAQSDVDP